jgi:hypothetical protein|tara:strand:+ start:10376 stop:10525 length:150 start_codon:yes stop_codon:yes gene_type:complete
MQKLIDWIRENKITVAFMGGAIVISSAYGTCTVDPTPPEPQQEEADAIP